MKYKKGNRPIITDGDVAYVTLTQGFVAVIDSDCVGLVDIGNWSALNGKNNNTVYAQTGAVSSIGRKTTLSMHRLITSCPSGFYVDHIDGNGLNNRLSNLRVCLNHQNQANAGVSSRNTSGKKGVHWHKSQNRWIARIKVGGKEVHLGCFKDMRDAEEAYRIASMQYHGKFSYFSRESGANT